MASESKIETERIPRKVCRKKECKNYVKYTDYDFVIQQCNKEHPNYVKTELVTHVLIWCLVLPKKYEKIIGLVDPKQKTVTVYEVDYPSTVRNKETKQL